MSGLSEEEAARARAAYSQALAAAIAAERAKALGAYSEALAVAAASWGSPLVTMYCLRHNDSVGPHPKAAVNTIWRMEDISTPALSQEAGYVTPNVNTLYGFGFLDLAAEPVILSVPDSHGRYYMVEIVDFWTNAFAYAGGVATGYKGGKFALVGPGWKGKLPPHVTRINSPTRWVLVQPRVHVLNKDDLPAAKAVLDAITVEGLAKATGKPSPAAQSLSLCRTGICRPEAAGQRLGLQGPAAVLGAFRRRFDREPAAGRPGDGAPAAVQAPGDRARPALGSHQAPARGRGVHGQGC